MINKNAITLALSVALASTSNIAVGAFYIEYGTVTASEKGLMSNRTHYEQDGNASFRMSESEKKPAQKRYEESGASMVLDLAYRVVTHRGSGKVTKIQAFADSIPMDNALALIIPKGWQVYKDKNLDDFNMNTAVSFDGNMDWTDALAVVGEHNAIQFHVDWYDHVVMMKKGRVMATTPASNIRIINEPVVAVAPKAEVKPTSKPVTSKPVTSKPVTSKPVTSKPVTSEAKATGIGNPDSITSSPKDATSLEARKERLSAMQKEGGKTGVADAKDAPVAAPAAKPAPVAPPSTAIFVRKGTLSENVTRLSKEHGWNAPKWQIDGDYAVTTSFSISGESFESAMAKLLMIHPIEADINRTHKIIYILRESHK